MWKLTLGHGSQLCQNFMALDMIQNCCIDEKKQLRWFPS
jgi:hypothetical protein